MHNNKYRKIIEDNYGGIRNTSFKQQCIDLYGEDYGVLLYNFYRKCLDFGGNSLKSESLSKRRLNHIQKITSLYSEYKVRSVIFIIESDILSGKTWSKMVKPNYFESILTGFKSRVERSRKKQEENKKGRGIPIPKKKVRTEYEDERFNWEYTCSECKGVVIAWDEECQNPKCKVWFRWNYMELPNEEKEI